MGVTHSQLISDFYNNNLRENAISRRFPSFFLQYRIMRPFLSRSFPFCYLKKGQKAIQVGCAEWLLDFGVSQALIMSAIVGEDGRVLVIEPDKRNVLVIKDYLWRNHIQNVQVIQKGVWKHKGKELFTYYKDRTSTNVLSEGNKRIISHDLTPHDYHTRPSYEVEIDVDTLDNIVSSLDFRPDFINMTINGTELEAIQGMEVTLINGVTVAFPTWGPRDWYNDTFKYLESLRYKIVVKDAPYTRRKPNEKGKVRFWDRPGLPEFPYALAIK